MLKKSYGVMKIKECSVLYHASDKKFKHNTNKPMLFCTFHPSEWYGKYITKIRIKKDISLLFMIDLIKNDKIWSSLNKMTNDELLNLAKMKDKNLECYVEELKKDKLNGWFSSIENKTTVEIALINSSKIFEAIETDKLKKNWRNGNCANENNTKIPKNWGYIYKISTIERPVKLKINLRYKKMIEEYKKYEKRSGYPFEYVFQVLLENAKIFYHKEDFKKITWNC